MAYPTTAELVGASSVEALTSLSSPEQDSLRDAAIAAVERYCNQAFTDEPNTTRVVNGSGAMYLMLPKRLYNVDSCRINDVAVTVADLGLNDRKNKLYFKSLVGSNYYEREFRDWDGDVLKFSLGVENVSITGDWGWQACPPAIAVALRYDMEDSALAEQSELGPTIQAYRKLGLKDASQGNLGYAMGEVPAVSDRVVALLGPDYIWFDPAGIVV